MREIRRTIIISLLILASSFVCVQAQKEYRVKDVPNIQLRDRTQFVSDPEGVLSESDLSTLNREILEMRDSLTVQVAIVILPAIDGRRYGDAREFANELFNDWGIGIKNADNGLLILLLTAEGHREITFETGYAVEGVLTDGLSKLIQTKAMVPHFQEGEWGAGLISGLSEIRKAMEGDSELLRAEEERQAQEDAEFASVLKAIGRWNIFGLLVIYLTERWLLQRMKRKTISYKQFIKRKDAIPSIMLVHLVLFTVAFFIYSIFKAIFSNSKRQKTLEHFIRCEHCGHQGLVKFDGSSIARKARLGTNGLRSYQFHCDSCGHAHEVLIPFSYIAPASRSGSSGPWGGGGGGFGGGGGSWGGGMSGGGGASTRF